MALIMCLIFSTLAGPCPIGCLSSNMANHATFDGLILTKGKEHTFVQRLHICGSLSYLGSLYHRDSSFPCSLSLYHVPLPQVKLMTRTPTLSGKTYASWWFPDISSLEFGIENIPHRHYPRTKHSFNGCHGPKLQVIISKNSLNTCIQGGVS